MADNLPVFISAEAAVKSKRPDYISLFDPKADINNLKKCRADPATIKEAVQRLKQSGFLVASTTSWSVYFSGPPGLMADAFSVEMLSAALPTGEVVFTARPKSSQSAPLASFPVTGGKFADLLADVRLINAAQAQLRAAPPPKNDPANDLHLEELYANLGGTRSNRFDILEKVYVLDTDIIRDHPWFQGKRVDGGLPLVGDLEQSRKFVRAFGAVERFLDQMNRDFSWIISMHDRPNISPNAKLDVERAVLKEFRAKVPEPDWSFIRGFDEYHDALAAPDELTEANCINSLLTARKEIRERKTDAKRDAQETVSLNNRKNHGTAVTANLLAIAPTPKVYFQACGGITVESDQSSNYTPTGPHGALLSCLTDKTPALVNCSWRSKEPADEPSRNYARMSWACVLETAKKRGALLVMASGNWQTQVVPGTEPNTNHPHAIVVGAAFRPDGASEPHASNLAYAHGAQKGRYEAMPNICGLSAGFDGSVQSRKGLIYCPGADPDWELLWGTSFAAPQVAGVCLLVWQVCRRASPADVKAILIETATPIKHGMAWNPVTNAGYSLWNEKTGHKVGLVNIDDALTLAELISKCFLYRALHQSVTAASIIDSLKVPGKVAPFDPTVGGRKLSMANGEKLLDYESARQAVVDPLRQATSTTLKPVGAS